MKKRKVDLESKGSQNIYSDEIITISKESDEYFFEIGTEMTNDIAEAVSILMRRSEFNSNIWDLELKDVFTENITPEKALFWLTGGYTEWRTLEHYNKPWSECYLDFQEEFGMIIINIVKKSKSLKDIRNNFIKYLNLPTLYEFSISKNMIR
jgi:hypothetical protein